MATATGGDNLIRRLQAYARTEGPHTVAVGFGWGDTYPTGQSLPLIAAIQEYGAPAKGIPPRPFMRLTMARNKGAWPAIAAARYKARGGDLRATLQDMGEVVRGDIQDTIRSNVPPPNAPITEARKGFNRTLIDTGLMLQHVKWAIEE